MKTWIPLTLAALALAAAPAHADAPPARLTIALQWENVPRTDPAVLVSREARVTGNGARAKVTYQRRASGLQVVALWYPEGFTCQGTLSKGDSPLVLGCGHPDGLYQLSKSYDGNVELEWIVFDRPPGPASVSGEVVR